MKEIEHAVEPFERELIRGRLKLRPTERPDGDQIHPRAAHQLCVLCPDAFRPLLRIVIAPVEKLGCSRRYHGPLQCPLKMARRTVGEKKKGARIAGAF